jgi:hypothetical protein
MFKLSLGTSGQTSRRRHHHQGMWKFTIKRTGDDNKQSSWILMALQDETADLRERVDDFNDGFPAFLAA